METTVFPKSLEALKTCVDLQQVGEWREQHCKSIYERKLGGNWDAILAYNPQDEESKDDLTMSQRVYIEAQKLVDGVSSINRALDSEQRLYLNSLLVV